MTQVARALNQIAAFLALDDLSGGNSKAHFDCIILAGNSVLKTAEGAFGLVRSGRSPTLLISGGVGHSTELLWQVVAKHPVYRTVPTIGRPEAHILRDIATNHWGLDPSRILIDDESTNCGENASCSRKVLEQLDQDSKTILLVQDPTMQRRTDATFRNVWNDRDDITFLNWPTFTPSLCHRGDGLMFENSGAAGLWPLERFISLVLGEVPRLRNDASGYGPKGRGFIAAVDIPEDVEEAYAFLRESLGQRFDTRARVPIAEA